MTPPSPLPPPPLLARTGQVVLAAVLLAAWMGTIEAIIVSLSRSVPEPLRFLRNATLGYAVFGLVLGVAWGLLVETTGARRPWRRRAFALLSLAMIVLAFQLVLHTSMHWISNRLFLEVARAVRVALIALAPLAVALAVLWILCRRWRPLQTWPNVLSRGVAITLAVPLLVPVVLPTIVDLATPTRRASVPNVLMIVLDTTRADRLSAYGYDRPTTPALERLAAEGLTFTRAYSAAPWTLPSHASIFTGKYPSVHNTHWRNQVLDEKFPTLAEHLSSQGLRTAAFARQVWLCDETRLMRGFEDFHDLYWRSTTALTATWRMARDRLAFLRGTVDKGASDITATFTSWIDRHGDEPFFAFINYVEPHAEYRPPAPFRDQFLSETHRDTPWGAEQDVEVQRFNFGKTSYDEQELAIFGELYDGEVAYQDMRMGEAIDHLRHRGLLDDTLVIVTADHGENLGDHGLLGHELCVYDTLLHVPLVVRLPGVVPAGETDETVVENRLLWSMIDAVLFVDDADTPMTRATIADTLRRDQAVGAPAYAELRRRPMIAERWKDSPNRHLLERSLHALIVGDMKYIHGSDDSRELYNLRRDPEELINLASLRREDVAALAGLLEAKIDQLGVVEAAEEKLPDFSEDLKRRLRSLGYLD